MKQSHKCLLLAACVLLALVILLFGNTPAAQPQEPAIQCTLPEIPEQLPVFRLTELDQEGSIALGLTIGEGLGAKFDSISYKSDSTMFLGMDKSLRAHMLVVDSSGGYSYSSPKPAAISWETAHRKRVEQALEPFGISIPTSARFAQEEDGWHSFFVAAHIQEDTLTAGTLRCRYASDGTIRELEQGMLEYPQAELVNAVPREQVLRALYELVQEPTEITDCRLEYIFREAAFVPVYHFTAQKEPQDIWLPALAEGE